MPGPDYIIEIPGLQDAKGKLAPADPPPQPGPQGNPWLAIHFKCCQVYGRIYRNRAGTAYEGCCPKCGSQVRAAIGKDGTASRFFQAE